MKVLVIGSGGREHALVWKIAQSPLVNTLYCAPGNPGIAQLAQCVDIGVNDISKLVSFARDHEIDLTVVGPEDPLAAGIVDAFAQEGLAAFGPNAAAAQLEASKVFAKDFMHRHHIPTADYAEFDDADDAIAYVKAKGGAIVVKADGLAAGKGVTVAETPEEAVSAIRAMMVERAYGAAGAKVILEERLVGEEASILAFCDGTTVVPMIASQDHKPVFNGDRGPNTGGMGAYSPAPVVTPECLAEIEETVLRRCVEGMAQEGHPYSGILYAGLMITASGPKVIEFNCRFGDPETQVVLPQMESDLIPVLLACCNGTLAQTPVKWKNGACVTVVMASGGYPRDYAKGIRIDGIERAETEYGSMVFHAGTKQTATGLVTNGGRVLNVTAIGPDIATTIEKTYAGVRCITFQDAHYRTDIGHKALDRLTR